MTPIGALEILIAKPMRHITSPASTNGERFLIRSDQTAKMRRMIAVMFLVHHTGHMTRGSSLAHTYGGTVSSWLMAVLKPKPLIIDLGQYTRLMRKLNKSTRIGLTVRTARSRRLRMYER